MQVMQFRDQPEQEGLALPAPAPGAQVTRMRETMLPECVLCGKQPERPTEAGALAAEAVRGSWRCRGEAVATRDSPQGVKREGETSRLLPFPGPQWLPLAEVGQRR